MEKRGRPRKGAVTPDTVQLSFRFPRALVDAIDAHLERMLRRKNLLMSGNTRSDAARELIVRGLESFEQDAVQAAERRKP